MNTTPNQTAKPSKPLWFFICLGILGLGIGSFILLRALKPEPEQNDPALLIPTVATAPLTYRDSPLLITGNGIVTPRAEIGISSQVNGEVVEIHPQLQTGGSFKAGETMIQIDPRSFAANLAEAEATQQSNQSALAFVNKQIERLQSLRKDGYTPEESLDDAINRRDQTLASIARQEAVIINRKLDLERTAIKAPFDGRVLSESVNLGDIVAPGRELARFYASDKVEIVTSLNSEDSVFIPGLWSTTENAAGKAWIEVNHGGHLYQWQGVIDRVEADIDSTTRTVDVVISVPNPFTPGEQISTTESSIATQAPPLLIGMYATVDIEGMTLPRHFVLPVSALRADNTIWVLESENRLAIEPVEFVRQEGNEVVLLAPQLQEGTQIIVSNIALVSNGMRVYSEASQ